MNDKIYTHLNGKYTPLHALSLSLFTVFVFQEHFLNKHNRAKMQIDTKKKEIRKTNLRENDSIVIFTVSIVDYQTSSIWIGETMLCHFG